MEDRIRKQTKYVKIELYTSKDVEKFSADLLESIILTHYCKQDKKSGITVIPLEVSEQIIVQASRG